MRCCRSLCLMVILGTAFLVGAFADEIELIAPVYSPNAYYYDNDIWISFSFSRSCGAELEGTVLVIGNLSSVPLVIDWGATSITLPSGLVTGVAYHLPSGGAADAGTSFAIPSGGVLVVGVTPAERGLGVRYSHDIGKRFGLFLVTRFGETAHTYDFRFRVVALTNCPPFDSDISHLFAQSYVSMLNKIVGNGSSSASNSFQSKRGDGRLSVSFSMEYGDFDGEITSAVWCFGDGSPPVTRTPHRSISLFDWPVWSDTVQHTYSSRGTYTVTLSVTDDGRATTVAEREITVPLPRPSFDKWVDQQNKATQMLIFVIGMLVIVIPWAFIIK